MNNIMGSHRGFLHRNVHNTVISLLLLPCTGNILLLGVKDGKPQLGLIDYGQVCTNRLSSIHLTMYNYSHMLTALYSSSNRLKSLQKKRDYYFAK